MLRYDEAVNPYRAQELRRPTLELVRNRSRIVKLVGGLLVIVASVALFAACVASGISIVFVGPFALGAVLIAQARSGAIVLRPEERAGEVVLRGVLRTKRTPFAYEHVVGRAVERVILAGRPADWQLFLALTNKRKILLARGGDTEIDAALTALDAFLADNGLTRSQGADP